jgi:hypothetical protein
MTDENDLYTDYALQIFSSFIATDVTTMTNLFETFRNDKKEIDPLFMPGIIYGMMFHMQNIIETIADAGEVDVQYVFEKYAIDYASMREDLIDNPLLNVKKARENFEKLMKEVQSLDDIEKWMEENWPDN